MNNQIQCPECKSYKTESFKLGAVKFGFGCIIGSSIEYYYFPNNHAITIYLFSLGILCIINGFKIVEIINVNLAIINSNNKISPEKTSVLQPLNKGYS
jgi:hypothetical protein